MPNEDDFARGSHKQWEKTSPYFGLAPDKDSYIKRFALQLRTGKSYSIPYALLPVIELDSNQTLRILSHDLKVTITGRNLKKLAKHLGDEKVTWIKEDPSGKDSNEESLFVSSISIECEFMY